MKPQLVKPDSASEDGLTLRLDKPEKRKTYTVPLLIAAAVHVLVIGAIALSLGGKHKAAPKPPEAEAPAVKAERPALRTEPQSAAPVQAAPVVESPSSAVAPLAKPAAPKSTATLPVKKAPTTVASKKSAKAATAKSAATAKAQAAKVKAAQVKAAKAKAGKIKTEPRKKPAPAQKKTPVLDLEALSKMGGAKH